MPASLTCVRGTIVHQNWFSVRHRTLPVSISGRLHVCWQNSTRVSLSSKVDHLLCPRRDVAVRWFLLGSDQNDQLFRIFLLLGEPTADEIRQMQPKSPSMIAEQLQRRATSPAESRTLIEHLTLISQSDLHCVELCRRLLQYSPDRRLTAMDVLVDRYYQEIHDDDPLKTRLALNSLERDLFHSLSSRSIANENKSSSNQTPNQWRVDWFVWMGVGVEQQCLLLDMILCK